MRNPLGYNVLKVYQQGQQIYRLTREFTVAYLHPVHDLRLIGDMVSSGRSVPRNISEGYGRNNTQQYYDFLGFSLASLLELLEDYLDLEKDIKGGLRNTKDNKGALEQISQLIKLCMGEKTMLLNLREEVSRMATEQGLKPQRQADAEWKEALRTKWQQQDAWVAEQLRKAREKKDNKGSSTDQLENKKDDKGSLGKTKEALLSLVFLCLPLLSLVLSLVFPSGAHAAITERLPITGQVLTNPGLETVADGDYEFIFKVYNAETSGTKLWEETQTVGVKRGIFTAALGTGSAFGTQINWNAADLWLEVTFNGDSMTPRKRILPTATALNTTRIQGVDFGLASNGDLTMASGLIPSVSGVYNLGSSTNHFATVFADTISAGSTSISGTESTAFTINTGQTTNNTDSASLRFYLGPTLNDHSALQWTGSSNRFDLYSRLSSSTLGDLRVANLTATGTLAVTGATTLSSTLGVTGATTLSSTLAVTGATTLSSTLGVTGATTLSSTLGVTGAATLSSTLAVTGAATLSSTLGVTGTSTLGILTVNGDATAGNTDITLGDATTDQLVINAAVASNVLPLTDNTYNLGSATKRWANFYAANAVFDQLSTPNTIAADFVINSDNATADAEDATLQFELGTSTPNAILGWNSTSKYLYFNKDLILEAATTFGNASTDTVSSAAATWTFQNDTAVTLSGGLNGLNFDANTLSIDATNDRVGIGTAAPGAKLDIASGNLNLSDGFSLTWGNGDTLFYGNSSTDYLIGRTLGTDRLRLWASGGMSFGSTYVASDPGAENFIVQGNVGIGTASPDRRFHIMDSDASIAPRSSVTQLILERNASTGIEIMTPPTADGFLYFTKGAAATYGLIGYIHASDAMQFFTNSTERLRIDSSGNVGIGTAVPQSLLDVQGPVGTGAAGAGILTLATKELTIVDGDELGRINFNAPLESDGSDAILAGAAIWAEADDTFSATVNSTELVFGTATTSAAVERMRIDSAGNVGIGTTAPGTLLHLLTPSATTVGLRIGVNGAQTANSLEILAPNGTNAFIFDGAGAGTLTMPTLTIFGGAAPPRIVSTSALNIWPAAGETFSIQPGGGSTVFSVTSAGNTTISGNTTLGDASGDTVTANAAAWTLANDTTIALSGGVDGINFDANTLSIDATNNRVGIGTASPDVRLDVTGTSGTAAYVQHYETADTGAVLRLFHARGTEAAPTATCGVDCSKDTLGQIEFSGYDGASSIVGARILAEAAGNGVYSVGANGTDLIFSTVSTSSATLAERLKLDSSANIDFLGQGAGLRLTTAGFFTSDGFKFGYNDNTTNYYRPGSGQGELSASTYLAFRPGNSEKIRFDSTGFVGIGTTAPAGQLHIAGNVSASAWGVAGIQTQKAAATFTDSSTAASGTATNAVFNSFGQPTLAATNLTVTTTNAATLYVAAAPTAGTNQTITNAYSFWVDAGVSRFDGNVAIGATSAPTYALTVLHAVNGGGISIDSSSATASSAIRAAVNGTERAILAGVAGNNDFFTGTSAGDTVLYNPSNTGLVFGTNATNRGKITSGGEWVFGAGDGGTSPTGATLRGPNGSGTNIAGVTTTVQASLATGTGNAGIININAATAKAASGTTAHTANTILTVGNAQGSHPSTAGALLNAPSVTWTDENTAASGTAAAAVMHAFQQPTLAARNTSVTTTDSATVYINAAPTAGTNMTLTNANALWVDAGTSRFDGAVVIGAAAPASGMELDVTGQIQLDLAGTQTSVALCGSHTAGSGASVSNVEIVDCTGTPAADYAEMYPVEDTASYGEIVALTGNTAIGKDGTSIPKLVRSSTAYQNSAIGVLSDNHGDFSSVGYNVKDQDNPKPVALNGRVPIKVTTENGPIAAGDYLTTSSTPGKAMKATAAGRVIGIALENWTNESNGANGQIMMFVANTYYNPTTGSNLQGTNNQFETLVVSGLAKIGSLEVATDAKVLGQLTAKDLVVTGTLTLNDQIRGSATVKATEREVIVPTTKVTATSKVYLTVGSGDFAAVKIKEIKPGESFTIITKEPVVEETSINWLIIE